MTTLCDRIKQTRKIKEASCLTYMSSLQKIRKKINGKTGTINNTLFLQDFKKVMDVINQENKLTSKKNKLTAVIVALTSDKDKNEKLIDKFGNELKSLSDKYMTFLKTQTKTETQKQNWIDYNDLIIIVNKVMKEVKHLEISKKKESDILSNKEFDTLQQYLILRTYLSFPLRNDFADMKIIKHTDFKKLNKDNKDKYNSLVLNKNKKQFHINQFKNKKYIGSKILDVPSSLSRIINLWLRFNKSGFYLVKKNRTTPMNPNSITKFLNKIFLKYTKNKKISTSMLRHIIISNHLKNEKTIKEKEQDAKDIENTFFHSKKINDLYRKVD